MKQFISGILTLVAIVLIANSAYRVTEGQQVLITQFGRIVGQPITAAGLHWKMSFIQEVRFFEKRILEWDGDPNQVPTKDKKFIWVDTTARWRITDAVIFAQTVVSERGARSRLDSIVDGATRDVISKHNLVEAVRNSNAILDRQKEIETQKQAASQAKDENKPLVVEEEITGEVEKISRGREKLSQMILERSQDKLGSLGIELIDVQLRRIAYEKSVEEKVYERMISERKRVAEKIRSYGKGEQAKIRGKLNQDLKQIESEAYRASQTLRGKADAEATAIYAGSLGKNPNFYEFLRTLEAYKRTLAKKGHFILSTDSEYLKLLRKR